ACYDCHSGQPRYPWYMNITPLNWWMQGHINESREHFDVSAWGRVSGEKRAHWAEEAVEMIGEEEMPLPSYTWTHGDARLSDEQRLLLTNYFTGLMH
nr:heme-binding domain-containing protein [Flavobacteriales bacterium]